MKKNLRIKLLAFLLVASMTGFGLKADDQGTTGHTSKAQKTVHPRTTVAAQTGIKAPPGVQLHPVVHSADINTSTSGMMPTQADYHTQQMY